MCVSVSIEAEITCDGGAEEEAEDRSVVRVVARAVERERARLSRSS